MRKATYNRKMKIEESCFKYEVFEYGYGVNKYCVKKVTVKGDKKPLYTHRDWRHTYEAIIDDIYITIPENSEVIVTETIND